MPLPPYLDLPPSPEPPPKNPKLALLLAALFGPVGLFYTSVVGGLLMSLIGFVLAVFTVGVGLFFVWPVCILWAYVAGSGEPPSS